ncbi:MAG: GreA/GreB family elongation factor [candidate division KSB1 bacterium]|nr:GreA/GreB family elongation factor [candidate division KSB1 bacterium]
MSENIPTLGAAATQYLASLPAGQREACQPEIYKFARWYGWETPFSKITAPAVASYAEQLSVADKEYQKKLEMIRSFLLYARKSRWTDVNFAIHLKTKKSKPTPTAALAATPSEPISLSREKYDEMKAELQRLKKRSQELVAEIQRAAADKDFRENAPLQAAREERGHVEGRIKEIEEILKIASIIEEKKEPAHKSAIGDTIILEDPASGEEIIYKIVDPREVDPQRGKISTASPLGKALLGRNEREMVEIKAPAGTLHYRIKKITR